MGKTRHPEALAFKTSVATRNLKKQLYMVGMGISYVLIRFRMPGWIAEQEGGPYPLRTVCFSSKG